MSDEAINDLINYARGIEDEVEEILEALSDVADSIKEKADCVANTCDEIAGEIMSDDELYERFVEKDDIGDLLNRVKKNLISDYQLFAALCADGFNMGSFEELVEGAFKDMEI